jgi:hypothetical protein
MRTSAGAANGIGQPLRRKEDFRLLTGRGRYGDDLALPRMVHAAIRALTPRSCTHSLDGQNGSPVDVERGQHHLGDRIKSNGLFGEN